MLHSLLYDLFSNKSTTDRSSGILAFSAVIVVSCCPRNTPTTAADSAAVASANDLHLTQIARTRNEGC